MASGDKQYIADKETLDAIKALIGLINDTGGTATAGTLMAKLNAVINYVLTNNSGSATGTLSQKMTKAINDLAAITTKLNDMMNNGGMIPYTLDLHKINTTLQKTVSGKVESTSLTTLVNITGKGVVNNLVLDITGSTYDRYKGNAIFSLIIDGVTYPVTISYENRSTYLRSFKKNFGAYAISEGNTAQYTHLSNIFATDDERSIYTPAYLRFKSSLKLTGKLSSTPTATETNLPSYSVTYRLL